jgi:integrase
MSATAERTTEATTDALALALAISTTCAAVRGQRKRKLFSGPCSSKVVAATLRRLGNDVPTYSEALSLCLHPPTDPSLRLAVLRHRQFKETPRLGKDVVSVKKAYASILQCMPQPSKPSANALRWYGELAVIGGLCPSTLLEMSEAEVIAKLSAVATRPQISARFVCATLLSLGRKELAERLPFLLPGSHTWKTTRERLEYASPFAIEVIAHCDEKVARAAPRTTYPECRRSGILQKLSYLLEFIRAEQAVACSRDTQDPLRAWFARADLAEVRRVLVAYSDSQVLKPDQVKTFTRRHSARNVTVFASNMVKTGLLPFLPCLTDPEKLGCKDLLLRMRNRRTQPPLDLRRTLTQEEVRAMEAAAEGQPREQLLLSILSTVALRNSAIGCLTYGQLVDAQHRPRALCSIAEKGRTVRHFVPPPALLKHVVSFVEWFRPLVPAGVDIFKTYVGNARSFTSPMGTRSLQRFVKRLAHRAGVTGVDVHPQGFRHTLVGLLMDQGVAMATVSKFMGHMCTSTTMKSYWITDIERLVSTMKNPFGLSEVGAKTGTGTVADPASDLDCDLALAQAKLCKVVGLLDTFDFHLTDGARSGASARDVQCRVAQANPEMQRLLDLLKAEEDEEEEEEPEL